MRYAIISDVHANLEALEATLAEIDRLGADGIFSLGDAVGYNANPNECAGILTARGIPSIMGNHDAAGCGREEPVDFNPVARRAALWTRESLEPEAREFLLQLPEQRRLGSTALLVHGSMLHRDHYLFSRYDMAENVSRMRADPSGLRLLFFGHTHCQVAVSFDETDESLNVISSPRFSLEEDSIYLINPGSVGQPRDRNPRSAFLVYDEEDRTVEFFRVSYDIEACARKILSHDLPRELADRLYQGR